MGQITTRLPTAEYRTETHQIDDDGAVPDKILAAKLPNTNNDESGPPHATMTRPLCPYPQTAKYKGSGDDKDATNFTCAAPTK